MRFRLVEISIVDFIAIHTSDKSKSCMSVPEIRLNIRRKLHSELLFRKLADKFTFCPYCHCISEVFSSRATWLYLELLATRSDLALCATLNSVPIMRVCCKFRFVGGTGKNFCRSGEGGLLRYHAGSGPYFEDDLRDATRYWGFRVLKSIKHHIKHSMLLWRAGGELR